MSLNEAADLLGLHYMTVYRYVRTGRLRAVKIAGQWQVDLCDVDRLLRREAAGQAREPRHTWGVSRMLDRLLAGDESGAWMVAEAALISGADPSDVHLEVLAPALQAIGDRWEAGELDVGDEHRASLIVRRLIGRLGPLFARPGRKRGVILLGSVAGERHEIPGAMVADELRGCGYEVVDLGADTPAGSFLSAAERFEPSCVLVSVTGAGHEEALADLLSSLRAETGAHVLVGGAAVPDATAALAVGSERWTGSDGRHVVAVVEELLGH